MRGTDPELRRVILGTLLAAFPGATASQWALDLIADGLAGHVLFGFNVEDATQLSKLTRSLRSIRSDVLIGIDEEGGDVTRLGRLSGSPYPGNGALGAINNTTLTRAIYRSIGADLATVGVNLNLAPSADVNTATDNPIIGTRSFGADAVLVSSHTAAAVIGLQAAGVAACTKHFPGHGATIADSHVELPTVDVPLSLLTERDLPPFAAAIAAGTQSIMSAHIRVPSLTGDLPATFSRRMLTDLLRTELGFTGVIVTDAIEMQGAARIVGGTAQAAVPALVAGADLICIGADVTSELVEQIVELIAAAVTCGDLPLARLEEAASRTAALAKWASAMSAPSQLTSVAGIELGLVAARRAVTITGTLPPLDNPLIVQFESGFSIAEGRFPWGVYRHVRPDIESLRLEVAQTSAADLHDAAHGRPIVVAGRNLHRFTGAADIIESLARTDDVVVVEMGWPSSWRPASARAFVTTYGATQANSRAVAEALGLTT